MDEGRGEREALEHALSFYRDNREGVLEYDQGTLAMPFVIDNADGRIVACLNAAALLSSQCVLYVPELVDDALQMLLSVEECAEGEATDRWMAHHGEPEHVHWVSCWVDSVRHGPWVFDGEAFMGANPLAAVEGEICRGLNGDRAVLARLCAERGSTEVDKPVCVGVDPWGLSVRARFGVVRLRFPARVESCEEARRVVGEWME